MIMIATAKRIIGNEDGFALGASILISAVLLLAGVLALWTSNTEMHVVRNEAELTREFYASEGGLIDALENYDTGPTAKGGNGATNWLTDQFLLDSPSGPAAYHRFFSLDANGQPVSEVRVRCITDPDPVTGLPVMIDFNPGVESTAADAPANNLPLQRHVSSPPEGSGFSLKYFEVRRYSVTANSTTGNTRVQVGAYKVFNKY
ncbi:MAG: hypothetical protein HY895_17205 [Deltaproteobacteria bacterium]|nr:hypothetical protein [Deltaproteobacteria bacterium]